MTKKEKVMEDLTQDIFGMSKKALDHVDFKHKEAKERIFHAQFLSMLHLFLGKRFMKRVGWFNAGFDYYKDEENNDYGISIKFYGVGSKKDQNKIKKIILKNLINFAFLIDEITFAFDDEEGWKHNYSIKKDGSNLKIYGRYLL